MQALVVVAHPDDEAIFFSGLILSKKYDWSLLCATDGNADGNGEMRQGQLARSCRLLGIKSAVCMGLPDVFEQRLDVVHIAAWLASQYPGVKKVFTHGVLGEYGHAHHQDVSYATHLAFEETAEVYSAGYNTYPDLVVKLTERQFRKKTQILWDVYSSEFQRFLNFLPATSVETFTRVRFSEIKAVYKFLIGEQSLDERKIRSYRWLIPHLIKSGGNLKERPF